MKSCYDESPCDKSYDCEECGVYLFEISGAKKLTNCQVSYECYDCSKMPCISFKTT